MSEPIHGSERLPTVSGPAIEVWYEKYQTWVTALPGEVRKDEWWRFKDQTPPPEPPEPPKRFVAWCDEVTDRDGEVHQWDRTKTLVEKFPTDPDWDELLDAIDSTGVCTAQDWANRVKEVRNRTNRKRGER